MAAQTFLGLRRYLAGTTRPDPFRNTSPYKLTWALLSYWTRKEQHLQRTTTSKNREASHFGTLPGQTVRRWWLIMLRHLSWSADLLWFALLFSGRREPFMVCAAIIWEALTFCGLHRSSWSRKLFRCCADILFNARTYSCCADILLDARIFSCCADILLDARIFSCCADILLDARTFIMQRKPFFCVNFMLFV